MPPRFALRFESSERSQEQVPLDGGVFSVGRKAGNSLQILDNSVSGKHAELTIDDDGCSLTDLDSTNGTRVDGLRVKESRLTHGVEVAFGNVRLVFLDLQRATPPPGARAPSEGLAQAGEAMSSISTEKVARAAKRSSALALAAVLALAVALAAVWWLSRSGPRNERESSVLPVAPVASNLLAASYSFEAGETGATASTEWENQAQASAAFARDSSARHSGASGLLARLDPGCWAEARSEIAPLVRVDRLGLEAYVRARGRLDVRVGLELSRRDGKCAPLYAFAAHPSQAEDWEQVAFETPVPPGFDQARAIAVATDLRPSRAQGPGDQADDLEDAGAGEVDGPSEVALDDVSLVPLGAASATPSAKLGETQLLLAGAGPSSAVIVRIDRTLVGDISVSEVGAPRGARLALEARAAANSLELFAAPATPARTLARPLRLSFWLEPELVLGGVATLGQPGTSGAGFALQQSEFQKGGVASLVAGRGRDMVQISFAAPAQVSGAPREGRFLITVEWPAADPALALARFQLVFIEEFSAAAKLAARAEQHEQAGEMGSALAAWTELESTLPFDRDLLERAQASRARLLQSGWDEFQRLAAQAESARFFALAAVVRDTLAAAGRLGRRYQASEIALKTAELESELTAELARLDATRQEAERARQAQIARVLDARGEKLLAERVRENSRLQNGPAPSAQESQAPQEP